MLNASPFSLSLSTTLLHSIFSELRPSVIPCRKTFRRMFSCFLAACQSHPFPASLKRPMGISTSFCVCYVMYEAIATVSSPLASFPRV
ncbi:hypothetical protein L209DRAFT_135560 [Thermothelomyces heterothallicus CBS 203.75]